MSGWGSTPWGLGTWGDGIDGSFALTAVLAVRENVLRLAFNQPVYFSGILDPPDGSNPKRYSVAIVAGTTGLDGEGVRPVAVVAISVPTLADGLAAGEVGRFVDLTLDRPMSAEGAFYTVAVNGVFNGDQTETITSAQLSVDALFKRVEPPQIDTATPSRDIANPQTQRAMLDPLPNPDDPLNLGTIPVDDTGDYAFDEGLTGLKKRVLRRYMTEPGAFAHLPNYGIGVGSYGKRLATPAVLADLTSLSESQIAREPDVAQVRVHPVLDRAVPGLVRFRTFIRPKVGPPVRFDFPFQMAS